MKGDEHSRNNNKFILFIYGKEFIYLLNRQHIVPIACPSPLHSTLLRWRVKFDAKIPTPHQRRRRELCNPVLKFKVKINSCIKRKIISWHFNTTVRFRMIQFQAHQTHSTIHIFIVISNRRNRKKSTYFYFPVLLFISSFLPLYLFVCLSVSLHH